MTTFVSLQVYTKHSFYLDSAFLHQQLLTMYESFEMCGSQQPGETYSEYLLRYKSFADAQPSYTWPPSSSPSAGLPTPDTSDTEDHELQTVPQEEPSTSTKHPFVVEVVATTNWKGYGFSSLAQDPILETTHDVKARYRKHCIQIFHGIHADTGLGSTRTRSLSTNQTKFYELDDRGNATWSRGYLAQRQKQRTLAEHRYERRLFSLIGRRPKSWYVFNPLDMVLAHKIQCQLFNSQNTQEVHWDKKGRCFPGRDE